jgi:hypothetical protein
MQVRPGQHTATIAQALAHNLSTSDRDFEMFRTVLKARGQHDEVAAVDLAQKLTHQAYAAMLELFGEEVGRQMQDADGHMLHDLLDHGHERSLQQQAHHDAVLARPFETR